MALAPALGNHGGVYMPYQRVSAVRLQLQPVHHPRSNPRPYTSFFIKDILGSKIGGVERDISGEAATPCPPRSASPSRGSPWSVPVTATVTAVAAAAATTGASQPQSPPGKDANFPVARDPEKALPSPPCGIIKDANGSPLSALEELANKTFTGLETSILRAAEAATVNGKRDPLHLFNRQPPRKKRKSRTAFNNQQIFELERRFLYQKYLTPSDRDEIASVLGLTNAQVITWFQNRRAKLKRDMEELTMDVTATTSKKCPDPNPAADCDAAALTAAASAAKTSPRGFKEEDGDEEEDDDDRLSTASEQQQCREQYSFRLASADDNSQHHRRHPHHLHHQHRHANLNAGDSPSGQESISDGNEPVIASPGDNGGLERGSCFAAGNAERVAEGEGEGEEEEESMDCSTSPSSGFHSDSEDK